MDGLTSWTTDFRNHPRRRRLISRDEEGTHRRDARVKKKQTMLPLVLSAAMALDWHPTLPTMWTAIVNEAEVGVVTESYKMVQKPTLDNPSARWTNFTDGSYCRTHCRTLSDYRLIAISVSDGRCTTFSHVSDTLCRTHDCRTVVGDHRTTPNAGMRGLC